MPRIDNRTVDQKLIDANFFGDEDAVYELFAQMRRDDPVHWTVRDDGVGFWSLFKHEHVKAVLNDARLFSTERAGHTPPFHADLDQVAEEGFGIGESILTTDPPRHTQVRAVLEPPFKPKAVSEYTARCEANIRNIFDRLPANGECDLVADVGARIPMAVICDILNVPEEDWDTILQWGKMTHQSFDHDVAADGRSAAETMLQGFRNMTEYCGGLSAARRGCPMDDPLALLGNAKIDGEPLSDAVIGKNGMLMLLAGFETTRNAFSGGVLALLQHPEQMQILRDNPKAMRLAVEEVLRWTNPAVAFRRHVMTDTELGGKRLKAGDNIAVWFPSANRDEEVFERPHEFNVLRHPNPHIGFGAGAHFCVGAPLAKLELSIALTEVLKRYDGMEITGPVQRIPSNYVFGLARLPVRLLAKTSA
ncbi:MAG: cytochrome P450 [Gammaproteobacteria bacterium]